MGLFSLVAVLLLEQIRPLPFQWAVQAPLSRLARFLEARFNAGERSHGVIAWLAGVGGLVLIAGGVYALLRAASPLLGWVWTVLALYLTLGFRQFSHYYSDIQLALRMDDLPHARALLAEWTGQVTDSLSPTEIARLAIEEALSASHRHVFGVITCFVLLPGPCGAILYRAAAFFADTWGQRSPTDVGHFGAFSRQAFAIIDWLPLRLTAAGFAIVGNFEDAIYCWRAQARKATSGIGIVLASGAGALGVRLSLPELDTDNLTGRAEMGVEADVDAMQSAVGLVWRALVLWLLLLTLLGLAGLVA